MKKVRVCHLTSVHVHTDNRVFFKECVSLSKVGYEVYLVAPGVEDHERHGVKICGVPKHNNRVKRVLSTALVHVFKRAKQLKADVYHFHDSELIPVGLMLRMLGKRVIYDVHENSAAAVLSRAYIKSKFVKVTVANCVKFLERTSARFFSAIVTARPDISETFKQYDPFLVRNLPILPIYEEIEDVGIDKKKPAVIFVGGMTEIRGIKELVLAMDKTDKAELWLLGFFPSKQFEEECKALPGWRNVRYLGQVEADQIFGYIKAADIGIVTFLPAPNHNTTLANKPFEYMSCGLPIIMSDFEYWREFFGSSAEYVNPADPAQIARAIDKMLDDKELRERMGKENLELTRNEYNWQKESDILFSAYKYVLTGDKR